MTSQPAHATGRSVDRFLFVWASFRIHTGSWDVRLMYLWGEQSQGTALLASSVVYFMIWHPLGHVLYFNKL